MFLFLSGREGLRLSDLSQENYFSKVSHLQWCPDMTLDMDALVRDYKKRKKAKEESLPKSDIYDDELDSYKQRFEGVLDMQHGMDAAGETHYFLVEDLRAALPDVPEGDITGGSCTEKTYVHQDCIRDRPCRGCLLKDKQRRNDYFFPHAWGTACALALLKLKLRDWCAEEKQEDLINQVDEDGNQAFSAAGQERIFMQIIEEVNTEPTAIPTEPGEADDDAETAALEVRDEEVPSVSATAERYEDKLSWVKTVSRAAIHLNKSLVQARRDRPKDVLSSATDWVKVAGVVAAEWLKTDKSNRRRRLQAAAQLAF